jgi:uncharacterized phosphosugar-binding protein
MYLDRYFAAVAAALERIRSGERAAIERAGAAVAAALEGRGVLHVMDTGHLLRHEAHLRAGGLAAITPFSFELALDSAALGRTSAMAPAARAAWTARLVTLALDASTVRTGDVMIINSNSGRTANVIEVAIQCHARGVTTVGIASSAQMRGCDAEHRSGNKLFDVADIAIDNCGVFGDAAVPVDNNEAMCPLSGITAAYILWAIQAVAVERLQAAGAQPTIYRSVHLGGMDSVERQQRNYIEKGV